MNVGRIVRCAVRALPAAAAAASSGLVFTALTEKSAEPKFAAAQSAAQAVPVNYQAVYNDIKSVLDELDYDDGSYGPVLVRLAWHAAGTFSIHDGTGGSNGATMRFSPEKDWGANAGLQLARDRLQAILKKHPSLTHADLWSLAGVCAIAEMGGPLVAWRPGRIDAPSGHCCPAGGRLPDATQGVAHLRDVFGRMGFNDQQIVALSGAHCLGRCHPDRSGFDGPWTRAPTTFSNEYFRLLLEEKWVEKTLPNGNKQFVDAVTGQLMMLPSDLALLSDPAMLQWVKAYAGDNELFKRHFAEAFGKLLELGVKFAPTATAVQLQ